MDAAYPDGIGNVIKADMYVMFYNVFEAKFPNASGNILFLNTFLRV